jgi:putative membrane protein
MATRGIKNNRCRERKKRHRRFFFVLDTRGEDVYYRGMGSLIIRIFLTAFTLLVVSEIIPGIHIDTAWAAVVAALLLGVLNVLIRPFLVLLMLPITILTLGLFIFVINAFLFLAAAFLIDGFSVSGFLPALVGSLIVSVVSTALHKHLT